MIFLKSCSNVYHAIRKTAHAVVSKSVVRAQNESRCFRALLLPPGQCPAQVLLQWEHGAFEAPEIPLWLRPRLPCPGRAGCVLPIGPGWLCKAEAEPRNSESSHEAVRRLLMAARVAAGTWWHWSSFWRLLWFGYVFLFFKPGLWLKMPRFQLTLPFKWLCKALSRFPAHIRSRAGSVSLQNKHTGCKSCDSEDRLQYSSPLLP